MAGDWIKLQKDTPDKPEVLAIAARLNLDPDAVVGKLCRIWSWFDTHTRDGNAECVTFSFLDRLTGVTGFAEQASLVGWLVQNGHSLSLPNFDYHNGDTAKTRALGKNRAEKYRSNSKGNEESNAPTVTKTSPEKRREEKSIKEVPTVLTVTPSAQRLPACPNQEIVDLFHSHLPTLPRVEVLNDGRKRTIAARWREVCSDPDIAKSEDVRQAALDWFAWYFGYAASSPFLTGKSKDWRADIDFLLTQSKFAKVVEGHYHKEKAA